jgi:hypothetical protein
VCTDGYMCVALCHSVPPSLHHTHTQYGDFHKPVSFLRLLRKEIRLYKGVLHEDEVDIVLYCVILCSVVLHRILVSSHHLRCWGWEGFNPR